MISVDTQLCEQCDGYAGFARAAPARCRAIKRKAHFDLATYGCDVSMATRRSSRSELLTAIEQEAEVCRQLAGKFLQLEATVLARQIRPKTPSKKAVDASRGGSGLSQIDLVSA